MTRGVERTYRVVFVQNDEEAYLDVQGTNIDTDRGELVVYKNDSTVAIWAEGHWKFVREYYPKEVL